MERRTRVAVLAALTVALTGGCADGGESPSSAGSPSAPPSPTTSPVTPGPPWHDEVVAAPAGVTVGGKGTPCELPVTFSVPAGWKVEAVRTSAKFGEAGLVGFTMICELDARPTGAVGFLRVWRGDPGSTQQRFERFLTAYSAKAADAEYRRVRAGTMDAVEASYFKEDGGTYRDRAVVMSAWRHSVVFTLDAPEVEELLPAYQLAKQSARINRD
ncbi:lipoprotein [Micromonospora sp. CPCC 205561]|uniref:lipoprotein n=1 Tax=Micromonospora sp. CPCC 205561 TaxID=3122407 RepID=UPI002FEF3E6C